MNKMLKRIYLKTIQEYFKAMDRRRVDILKTKIKTHVQLSHKRTIYVRITFLALLYVINNSWCFVSAAQPNLIRAFVYIAKY